MVTAINGARRLNCRFRGEAGHAGTVPMTQRKDALAAAAEWMVFIEQTTRQQGGQRVATVGTLRCPGGAVNVIPGEVELSLDIRGPEDAALTALLSELLTQAERIAARRGLNFHADEYYAINATACDAGLQQALTQAVTQVQGAPSRCRAAPVTTPSPSPNAGRSACCLCAAPAASAIIRRNRCAGRTWRRRCRRRCWRSNSMRRSAPGGGPMQLDAFNQLSTEQAQAAIAHCVAIPRWRQAVAAARPYASTAALIALAGELAQEWDETDFARALTAHPRIGERAAGEEKEAALSRREQAAVGEDATLRRAARGQPGI